MHASTSKRNIPSLSNKRTRALVIPRLAASGRVWEKSSEALKYSVSSNIPSSVISTLKHSLVFVGAKDDDTKRLV